MQLQDEQELSNLFERRVSARRVGVTGAVGSDDEFWAPAGTPIGPQRQISAPIPVVGDQTAGHSTRRGAEKSSGG
jgi:hypothetical protein